MNKFCLSEKGFTLLETMIAVAIMATLTLLIATTVRTGVDNQRYITGEINRDAQLADALRIMRSDIASAFHYQDIFCKMKQEATAAPTPPPGTPPTPPTGDPAANPCPPNYTGMIGDSESIYFTSLSNMRVLKDVQESDQAKIGYYLKGCSSTTGRNTTQSKCLYRSLSPNLDDKLDEPGPEIMLLENVEEFKLAYLGPKREELVENWRTWKDGTDEIAKENFPYAIEITLTTHNKSDPRDKPATQTVLAPISFPNNPPKKDPAAAPTPTI